MERVLTAPNLITFARILLVPVFLVSYFVGRYDQALACFAVASLSDGLDGLLARLLNQRSKLGAVLDPAADKLLVFAALVAMTAEHQLPLWLLSLVVARDVYMAAVALAVRVRRLDLTVTPTRVGKYATFTLFLLVVTSLIDTSHLVAPGLVAPYIPAIGSVAALAVGVSYWQYLRKFGWVLLGDAR